MNEVSIIINGVRWDAVEVGEKACAKCDLLDRCDNFEDLIGSECIIVCMNLVGIGRCFKKSDKKFER